MGAVDVSLLHSEKKEKVKILVRRGVPKKMRPKVWAAFSSADALLLDRPKLYEHAIRNTFPWVCHLHSFSFTHEVTQITVMK